VEPHFLFNTLAGVRSAVTGDPARAVEIVDRLVDYLRASIPRLRSSASEAEATLGAQLDVARSYLALMRSRLLFPLIERADIEAGYVADARTAVADVVPGVGKGIADRRDDAQSGDDDATLAHGWSP